jgi:DNA-binding MarR family transcriptional regulator
VEYRDDIGFQIRTLSHLVKRVVDQNAFPGEVSHPTGVQGWIIGYLYENQDKEVFQRDIQEQFSIRRSTVTGILQLMEKNGLIIRSSVDRDARLKRLELTPRAIEFHERIGRSVRQVEDRIDQSLTPEERQEFIRLCEKIRENLSEKP